MLAVVLDQAGGDQRGDVHRRAGLEPLEVLQVDRLVLDARAVDEATPERQLLDELQLATLEVRGHAPARAGVLALGPLAGRRAAPRAEAAADPPALPMGALRRRQLMEPHSALPSVVVVGSAWAAAPVIGSGAASRAAAFERAAPGLRLVFAGASSTSSTRTRCWTAKTIPRICGLFGRTTVWCSFRSPSARTVSFWRWL